MGKIENKEKKKKKKVEKKCVRVLKKCYLGVFLLVDFCLMVWELYCHF